MKDPMNSRSDKNRSVINKPYKNILTTIALISGLTLAAAGCQLPIEPSPTVNTRVDDPPTETTLLITETKPTETKDQDEEKTTVESSEPDSSVIVDPTTELPMTDETSSESTTTESTTLIKDDEPPVIRGVQDITVYVEDRVSYMNGVTAHDNKDGDVSVQIDNSRVNLRQEGVYEVIYSAEDQAGNRAQVTAQITVKKPVPKEVDEDALYKLADQTLEKITNADMTSVQVARAIYDFTRGHIRYVNESDKSDWLLAADQGLRQQYGDCYNYFAVAKLLLHRAGIENLDVLKSGGGHYWSMIDLGDGWYHFDTTPRRTGGEFFMKTDAQIEAYARKNENSHIWDRDKYPSTPEMPFSS